MEYTRVLTALGYDPHVVCRSATTADRFRDQTGRPVWHGGIEAYLAANGKLPTEAIVAVDVDQLAEVTQQVIKNGVKRVLLEKPGGLNLAQLEDTLHLARQQGVQVFIAYNRRFHASTQRAVQMIAEDGGVSSILFDFTERSKFVENSKFPPAVKAAWLLANSSHVIDLAFYLAGAPVEIQAQVHGSLPWHPSGARFSGIGVTTQGATFAYHADWECPGRWLVDIRTRSRRLLLCPLESLQVQYPDKFEWHEEPLADELDRNYKPGLYRLVRAFLSGEDNEPLLNIEEQIQRIHKIYEPVAVGGQFSSLRWTGASV